MDYKKIFADNLDALRALLKIKSIYDDKTVSKTTPYGKECKEALDYMKNLALKDGFIVKEYDNKVISISYIVNEDKRIDVVSHLDVVGVDDKWLYDPFGALIKDNKIYGRGTSDMKTAAFLTYICLKLLKDKYPCPNKEIRIVFGSDEERTMEDMHYYYAINKKPLFAFSPDGTFPMAIGEKGALMWTINGQYEGIIETFKGGIQCNIVAPYAKCILKNSLYYEKLKTYFKSHNIDGSVTLENDKCIVVTNGKAVHASRSFDGLNANIVLLKALGQVCNDKLCLNMDAILSDPYGKGLDIDTSKNFDDCLTVNLGCLMIDNGLIKGQVDARYPSFLNSKLLTANFKQKAIFDISLDYDDPPTLNRLDDPFIKIMLDTYREVSGDYKHKAYISGGVSYAKVFKHCVTFGMAMPYKENMAHQANEYVEIDDCIKALEIYHKTLEKFIEMDLNNEKDACISN